MADREITKRIDTQELAKLLDVASETTRVTAEIPAVDLDQLLAFERPEDTGIDLGALLREELDTLDQADIHDSPIAYIDATRDRTRLKIVFPAVDAFAELTIPAA